jgi:hypothetical protein
MKKVSFLIVIFLVFNSALQSQNVGIGTGGGLPHASTILDIDDVSLNNRGLLLPRVSLLATNTTSPIISPANSLLVYNIATAGVTPNDVKPGYYYWDGAMWIRMKYEMSTAQNWKTIGNAGTSPLTNFIGTADNKATIFKSNSTSALTIAGSGNVGIGGLLPHSSALLDVNSTNQGFLITRADTANITAPQLGVMTLNPADSCLYLHNGTNWVDNGGVGKKCKCYCGTTYIDNRTFTYTGADQSFTIPTSAKWLDVYCWGGGGILVGGFSSSHFDLTIAGPITGGSSLSVMVGDRQHNTYYGCGLDTAKCLYGFGGYSKKCANEGYSGAGLAGVFTGTGTILETDAARALVIAGGSGSANDNDCSCPFGQTIAGEYYGTSGNEPLGGGMPTFRGTNGTDNGSGGGGGGYQGGIVIPSCTPPAANPARGGSGYTHPAAIVTSIKYQYSTTSYTGSILLPPEADNCLYVYPNGCGSIAQPGYCDIGYHGLVVLQWGD